MQLFINLMQGGDRLRILTPGGGGYYAPEAAENDGGATNGRPNGVSYEQQVTGSLPAVARMSVRLRP